MPTETASGQGAPETAAAQALASTPGEGSVLAACCLGAATALGLTLQMSNGTMQADALQGLALTLVLSAAGVVAGRLGQWKSWVVGGLAVMLGGGLVLQLKELCMQHPGMYQQLSGPWPYQPLYWRLGVETLVVGALLASSERARRWLVPVLLVTYFSLGAWMLRTSPAPYIDVFVFEVQAPEALLSGKNPYSMTFPNIYGGGGFYGEGMVQNGRLLFGFPYPPLSLYLSLLGKVLGGDPRYAQLVAMTLAAGLMAYTKGGRLGAGAAALLLLTPRGLFVLEQAWTEPLLLGLLAITVFCAYRFPRALPYAFGLLVAVKQYTVFMLPLVVLLTPLRGRQLWGLLWRAGATTLAVSLPLVVPNPKAFMWSVVQLQFYQPFRGESLSYLAWWVSRGHPLPPLWVPFACTAVALALALWRAPRTPAGFAAATGWVYGVFFAFNKQAFSNYYLFVVGALCIALAVSGPRATAAPPR